MIVHKLPYNYDTKTGKAKWEFKIYFAYNLKSVLVQGVDPNEPKGKMAAYGNTCRIEDGAVQWIDRYYQPLHLGMYPQVLREHVARLLKMKVFW